VDHCDKIDKPECTVRNFSEAGASFYISTTFGMPSNFALIIDGVRHSCRIVWRTDTRLGVALFKAPRSLNRSKLRLLQRMAPSADLAALH